MNKNTKSQILYCNKLDFFLLKSNNIEILKPYAFAFPLLISYWHWLFKSWF